MIVNLTITLFSVTQKSYHFAENYARVMLAEISPLNPGYQLQTSLQSELTIFVLLLKGLLTSNQALERAE